MRRFVFLIHPRDVKDVGRRFPGNIVGEKLGMWLLPKRITEWTLPKLKGRCGYTICSRFKVYGRVEGILLAVLLTARQIVTLSPRIVRKRILEAVMFAQDKLHAEVIGLGELISSITEKGKWLTRQPGIKVAITHGDSYAVGVAMEAIERMISLGWINSNSVVGIVGAYGLIGSALSKILCKHFSLILLGRNKVRLTRLAKEIRRINPTAEIFLSVRLADLRKADLVITATSAPDAILRSQFLKFGAVIYDIAQPINVGPELLKQRPDIIRVDGDLVEINGIDLRFEMGPPKGTTFACLVETIIQTLDNEKENHVGDISLDYVGRIRDRAKKYGFFHAPFTCFGEPLPGEEIQKVFIPGAEKVIS
ncbi:MAG: hypothetical protein ACTSX6_14020 [Candidatus Heimdallarchaeaceae archaeon]